MSKLTYEEALEKIKEVQDLLYTYQEDPASLPVDFSYVKTVGQLTYLRNRIRQLKPRHE
jgi:hypothetical protein